jgi:hypothetical protein
LVPKEPKQTSIYSAENVSAEFKIRICSAKAEQMNKNLVFYCKPFRNLFGKWKKDFQVRKQFFLESCLSKKIKKKEIFIKTFFSLPLLISEKLFLKKKKVFVSP